MKTLHTRLIQLLFIASFASFGLQASEAIRVLNRNFEFDLLPEHDNKTNNVTGWVKLDRGESGVYLPDFDFNYSLDYSAPSYALVAFLDASGGIKQRTPEELKLNETYTLNFDTGWRDDQMDLHFVVRIKAGEQVIKEVFSRDLTIERGKWHNNQVKIETDASMPIGEPITIEFQNLALFSDYQVNLDNIEFYRGKKDFLQQSHNKQSVQLITESITYQIPEQFEYYYQLDNYLRNRQIVSPALVTIEVNDCSNFSFYGLAHPNGDSIQIIGNQASPESCVLRNSIRLDSKHSLGLLDGFTIQGNNWNKSIGIRASKMATINLGSSMIIRGFERGIVAELDSSVTADGVVVEDNSGIGFHATTGSHISANNAISRNNGQGFVAEADSVIEANNAEAFNNAGDGFVSKYRGTLHANNSIADANENGYRSHGRAIINAHGANARNNRQIGYYATDMSLQDLKDATFSGNATSNSPEFGTTTDNYHSILKR